MSIQEKIALRKLGEQLSDEELYAFCLANRHLRIERDKAGNIIIMSPVGPESGYYEGRVIFFLEWWNDQQNECKGIVFSSSTGFILPSGLMRSPDASWMPLAKWRALTATRGKGFPHHCPDFVLEVRSETDSLADLHEKMQEWLAGGAHLAWLIDPWEEKAYIYRLDEPVEMIPDWEQTLSGDDVLPGFQLELSKLRLP